MFSSIRGFLYRHRRKFIVSGILIGGAVLATRYAQKKLREWQERETKEFLERTRRQQHFESTERTCNQTILSLMRTAREAIVKERNTEELVMKLRSDPADKVPIWEDLKILAFTRASVLVYVATMMVVTLRIQLNLIGGYMFQDSVSEKGDGNKATHISSSLQEKYLSLCHNFVNEGIQELCIVIEDKIRLIVEGIPLKQKMNLQDIEQLFWGIQAAVSGDLCDPIQIMNLYFCNDCSSIYTLTDAEMLHKMISETSDLLESNEVISLASSCVSRGFSFLVDRISDYYGPTGSKSSLNTNALSHGSGYVNGISNFVHPNNVAMPMAKLIPIVNGLVPAVAGSGDASDAWVQQLILNDKLKLLGANVYEAFSNKM